MPHKYFSTQNNTLSKKVLFCSLNPLYLLDFKSKLKQTEVFRQTDVVRHLRKQRKNRR
jgi:hypothetical protein